MFDLWYAIGSAIMSPDILDTVITNSDAVGVAMGRPSGAPLLSCPEHSVL